MTLWIYTVGPCKHYFCRVIVFLMISEATWGFCHHHTTTTTTVFSRLLKLLLLRHLAAAAASTLHPQSKFCFPGAQPCVLLQSSKLLKEKLKGLHGSSLGCLLLLCLRTDSWLVDNSCSEHKEVAVRGGTQGFLAKTRQKISSLDVISRLFHSKCRKIHILSVLHYMSPIFKICKNFSEFHFWRVFAIWQNCVAANRQPLTASTTLKN